MQIKTEENKIAKRSPQRGFSRLYFPVLFLIGLVVIYMVIQLYSGNEMHSFHIVTMDTSLELTFTWSDSSEAEQIRETVLNEIERLETILSRTRAESEVSEINRQAGIKAVVVSKEVLDVTERAYEYALLSEGAFDPTIAPLIDLWGFLDHSYRVPGPAEIAETLDLVNFKLLQIDRKEESIYLPEKEMGLELGGIAKGFIVDRVLEVLLAAGVEHAFVNAGGDIGLIGAKPDGEEWRIGIRNPREEHKIIAIIPAADGSIVTSGDYERAFTENGVSYHHILDPETGMPARGLISVTILAGQAIEADALSTAVFVLGPERGMELIEKIDGAEGVLITPQLEIMVSSGLEDIIELHP